MSVESRDLDCRAAMRQLYDFLDQELPEEAMQRVRAHLDACRDCFAHASFEQDLLAALARGYRDVAASPELRLRIRQQLRAAGWDS